MPSNIKKPFKHSTTFYRKRNILQKQLLRNISPHNVTAVISISTQKESTGNELSSNPVTLVNTPNPHIIHTHFAKPVSTISNECIDVDIENDISEMIEESILTDIQKKEILKNWLISNQITHKATDELLHILSTFFNVKHLPKDARTFLRTPTEKGKQIKKMGCGEYWHNGLKNSLSLALTENVTEIKLSFNMDGLPLFKSAKDEFWPILCKIDNFPQIKPMVIGIYFGVGKPPCNDFLLEFVDELNDCVQNGVLINDRCIKVTISCFICDTPARSFIRGKELNYTTYSIVHLVGERKVIH